MIIIYSTFSDKKEAEKIAEGLLREKLAACVNIFPIGSVYLEEGKIEKCEEAAVFIKTRKINFKKVEKFLSKNHSYDIPCVIGIPVRKTNGKYFQWVKKTLKDGDKEKKL